MTRLKRIRIRIIDRLVATGCLALAAVVANAEDNPGAGSAGAALYEQSCIACHQADAIGKPGLAPSLTNPDFLAIASDEFLRSTIRDGRVGTGMPPFAHLDGGDIDMIIAYLRDHSAAPNRALEVNLQPRARGDPRLGQLWFDQICSTCHGVSGDGYQSGGTGTAIGKAGFLTKASDGFIRETIKHGRIYTRMLGFHGPQSLANLSAIEIDDIITYLRSLQSSQ